MSYRRRFGQFMVVLGAFLVALFVFSDITRQPDFGLLGVGVLLLAIGIITLVGNPAPPPEPSPRFRILKKAREKSHPASKPQKVENRSKAREQKEEQREKAAKEAGRSQ